MRKRLLGICAGTVLVVVACGDGDAGKNGSLLAVSDEGAGSNCEAGGKKVQYGADTDGNGTLDSEEVEGTEYVCDGAEGEAGADGEKGAKGDPGSTGEAGPKGDTGDIGATGPMGGAGPKGDTGPMGGAGPMGEQGEQGEQGEAGPKGDPGDSGTNGVSSLIALTPEVASNNCEAGGVRIDTGLDNGDGGGTSANGTLEAGEIDSTAYVCNASNRGTLSITSLTANSCSVVDHNATTGDDRGGIAVSKDYVYYTGDSATGRFDASDLANQTAVLQNDTIFSDLRTEKIYSLGAGADTVYDTGCGGGGPADFDRILALDAATGAVTGSISLSTTLSFNGSCYQGDFGIFSGPGFMAFVDPSRVYLVDILSGVVQDYAARPSTFEPASCENQAIWGVVTNDSDGIGLVYAGQSNAIEKTVVETDTTTDLATFSNLSDMCSISVSVPRQRWYFHHEGGSQFGGSVETIGYCDASLSF